MGPLNLIWRGLFYCVLYTECPLREVPLYSIMIMHIIIIIIDIIIIIIIIVLYREEIPSKGPPSYAGRFVRYTYKLTFGAQKPNCPAQIIRIPIRVITIPG